MASITTTTTTTHPAATNSHALSSHQLVTPSSSALHQLPIQISLVAATGTSSPPSPASNGPPAMNTSQPPSTQRPPNARQGILCNVLPTALFPKTVNWGKCIFNGAMVVLSITGVVFAVYQTLMSSWTARKDFRDDCFNQRVSGEYPILPVTFFARLTDTQQSFGNWSPTCDEVVVKGLDAPPQFPGLPLTKRGALQAHHALRAILLTSDDAKVPWLITCATLVITMYSRACRASVCQHTSRSKPPWYSKFRGLLAHLDPVKGLVLIIESVSLSATVLILYVRWRFPQTSSIPHYVAMTLLFATRLCANYLLLYLEWRYWTGKAGCKADVEDEMSRRTHHTLSRPRTSTALMSFIHGSLLHLGPLYIVDYCDEPSAAAVLVMTAATAIAVLGRSGGLGKRKWE
ncbi:hypothetical protein CLCR_04934 [Cladophialophora carrionii]|uniref:Uncharacterized protein n=1 Tax=Cladophialophora carrionii TaxID=86049 RepID=A0A1C1CJM9_9EURO|nr:hypothetical protein CLCR_04934 [Cladophialophora carrionii]